ncbi:hypothetical protein NHX12_005572, partial [Muraenolepis orangiensis]
AAYLIMKMNFYNEMAVRIQCTWRGFYVRKYIHNFYTRKRYMEGLATKHEQVRRGLDEIEDFQKKERAWLKMTREQTLKTQQTHQLHHLLTHWIRGTAPCCSPGHRLPPISSKKPQGPFREPEEVWRQRLRSPEFSLRLQTPYTDLEEVRREPWRFLPFTKAHHRNQGYERLLLGMASAFPLSY